MHHWSRLLGHRPGRMEQPPAWPRWPALQVHRAEHLGAVLHALRVSAPAAGGVRGLPSRPQWPDYPLASNPGVGSRRIVTMNISTTASSTPPPSERRQRIRICLPTGRRFSRMAFQCGHLEAQDVLVECDDVDLLHLEPEPGFPTKLRWLRRLMYRDVSRRLAFVNPGLKRVKLTKDYDVLVVMCQGYWEFLYVNALEGWKDHCKTSICWIDELWAADLPLYKYWLPSLRRFDHVVVGMHGTVAPLSELLGSRCHYVPGAVDALRF